MGRPDSADDDIGGSTADLGRAPWGFPGSHSRRIAAVLLTALILTGCAGPAATAHGTSRATSTPAEAAPGGTTEAAHGPTPAAASTVSTVKVRITCYGPDHTYRSYREAWRGKSGMCDGTATGTPDATQLKAVRMAHSTYPDHLRVLGGLYGLCAQSGPDAWGFLGAGYMTAEETRVMDAALILCPDHPDRDLILRLLAEAKRKTG